MMADKIFRIALIALLALFLVQCGEDDDDKDKDDPDDEAQAFGDTDWTYSDTAYEDFLTADQWFAEGIYSTAMLHYDKAIIKLTDAEPKNDGPDAAMTLDRCRYAYALCQTTVPLKILEGFIGEFLSGDTSAIVEWIVEDYKNRTGEQEPPTNLLTLYIRDLLMPELLKANQRLDAVFANEEFFYEMPIMRLTFMGTAITLPDVTSPDSRGRHDLVEANLLSVVLHMAEWLLRSVLSYNLDIDVVKIDEILWLIRNGDLDELIGMIEQYPNLLTPSTMETNGVDGREMLFMAYQDFAAFLLRLRDDDDQDSVWNPLEEGRLVDTGEQPDDLLDALWLDGGDQLWDLILLTEDGIGLNVRTNADSLRGSSIEKTINILLFGLLTNPVADILQRCLLGLDPPEPNSMNGLDDDFATGKISILEPGLLVDNSADFEPHSLAGQFLNPNVFQGNTDAPFQSFVILDNTETSLTVIGDPTAVAEKGDLYTVGDGIVDDGAVPFGMLLPLLGLKDFPIELGLGFFYGAFFTKLPNVRDIIPTWNEEAGNPDFFKLVVDQTESFEDLNGNGAYDPGVDVLHDADHEFQDQYFYADGHYQPYYFYFGDPTWGGMLHYATPTTTFNERHDAVNLLTSALVPLFQGLGKGDRP